MAGMCVLYGKCKKEEQPQSVYNRNVSGRKDCSAGGTASPYGRKHRGTTAGKTGYAVFNAWGRIGTGKGKMTRKRLWPLFFLRVKKSGSIMRLFA